MDSEMVDLLLLFVLGTFSLFSIISVQIPSPDT